MNPKEEAQRIAEKHVEVIKSVFKNGWGDTYLMHELRMIAMEGMDYAVNDFYNLHEGEK